MQISRKPPQQRWGGVRESAVLTYSQVVLMLLVWGPHLRTTGSESEGGTRAGCLVITLVIHTVAL